MSAANFLTHCLPGWRAVFCWVDNLVPHEPVRPELDDEFAPALRGCWGFRWVCRLHDRAGYWGRGS